MYEDVIKKLNRCYAEAAIVTDEELMIVAREAVEAIEQLQNNAEEKCKEWLKVKGKCPTCARCSDNREHTTTCPIEEHYALPLDGYCHLYEEKK